MGAPEAAVEGGIRYPFCFLGRTTGWDRGTALIAAHDLTKRYGDVLALDRLAVEIPDGAVFGLLGLLVTINDGRLGLGQEWAGPRDLASALVVPLGRVMSGDSVTLDAPAVAWTVLYALVLFLGATLLFTRKDLLWAE